MNIKCNKMFKSQKHFNISIKQKNKNRIKTEKDHRI